MKKIWLFIPLLILIDISLNFTGCSKEPENEAIPVAKINPDTLVFKHSFKGWELYSWPNGDDFNYSILIGTNRAKTYEEVVENKITVTGKDSLKMVLAKLPEEESIFWSGRGWLERCWDDNYKDLCLPDNKTVNEISEFCNQLNLLLMIDY